jgi:nucleoside-diphosphate-sugar epimerase
MKNALVFGVCEEMGKHLCQALIEQHWEVMGVIKENEINAPVLGNLTLVELTHTDLDFLYDLVEDVDAIFIHQPETDTNQRDNLLFPLEQIIQAKLV